MDDNLLMSRIDSNKEILAILEEYINKYPETRFVQALCNLNILVSKAVPTTDNNYVVVIADGFYEESSETLKRIKGLAE